MLTDTKLRNLKPRDKLYKVNDRDDLYVAVTPAGSISFRYNYSINGRQETITFGRYGVGGITLAEARERLGEAKRMVADGKSPAKEKARDKARVKGAETFGAWAEKWLRGYQMADSTRDMRRSVYTRELETKFGNQKLTEITHEDLRALTDAIVERGAPATAVHAREIVLQVYRWATERGQKVENPADLVRPASIARFEPRDRTLTPEEIRIMYQYMGRIGTSPSIRAAVKLLLLTMVRKSELTNATWSEINFSEALWTIPKERMKRRNPHLVFLSGQAMDILIALKTFSGGSEYVLPSRYDSDCEGIFRHSDHGGNDSLFDRFNIQVCLGFRRALVNSGICIYRLSHGNYGRSHRCHSVHLSFARTIVSDIWTCLLVDNTYLHRHFSSSLSHRSDIDGLGGGLDLPKLQMVPPAVIPVWRCCFSDPPLRLHLLDALSCLE